MDGNDKAKNAALEAELARRKYYDEALQTWWLRSIQRASEWDLETVKQLVVLNAAGLAGAATLLAGSKALCPVWTGPFALVGYSIGVACAILNMHLATRSFNTYSNEIRHRLSIARDLTMPTAGIFDDLTSGNRMNVAGQIFGWVSAIAAVASTVALGIGLIS